jgi:hypothetical protein
VVCSVGEKAPAQAVDRTRPMPPIGFGRTEKRGHDHRRHATTDPFAALGVGAGQVGTACFPRRRADEFLALMNSVAARCPDRRWHVVVDGLCTHTSEEIGAWLVQHRRITFPFARTGGSGLNMVEIWFGVITRPAIRRGTFACGKALIRAINDYATACNADAKPFTWTATAEEILAKVR